MPATKRATIYFDPKLHRQVRRRAAANAVSISKFVTDAVRDRLNDDDEDIDLEELERRRKEPSIPFEKFVRDLKRRGKL